MALIGPMLWAMRQPPHNPDTDLLDATIEAFQPMSREPLSREDAAEIVHNLGRYGALLQRWAIRKAARDAARDGAASPFPPDTTAEVSP